MELTAEDYTDEELRILFDDNTPMETQISIMEQVIARKEGSAQADPLGLAVDDQMATGRDEFGQPLDAKAAAVRKIMQPVTDIVPSVTMPSGQEDLEFIDKSLEPVTMRRMAQAPQRETLMDVVGTGQEPSVGMGEQGKMVDFLMQSRAKSKDSDAFEQARKALEDYGTVPVRGARSSFADETVDVEQDPLPEDFDASAFFGDEVGETFESPDKLGMAYIRNAMSRVNPNEGILASIRRDAAMAPEDYPELKEEMAAIEARQEARGAAPTPPTGVTAASQVAPTPPAEVTAASPEAEQISQGRKFADSVIEGMMGRESRADNFARFAPSIESLKNTIGKIGGPDTVMMDLEKRLKQARGPTDVFAMDAEIRDVGRDKLAQNIAGIAVDTIDTGSKSFKKSAEMLDAQPKKRKKIATDLFGSLSSKDLLAYGDQYTDYLRDYPEVRIAYDNALSNAAAKAKLAAQKDLENKMEYEKFVAEIEKKKAETAKIKAEAAKVAGKSGGSSKGVDKDKKIAAIQRHTKAAADPHQRIISGVSQELNARYQAGESIQPGMSSVINNLITRRDAAIKALEVIAARESEAIAAVEKGLPLARVMDKLKRAETPFKETK